MKSMSRVSSLGTSPVWESFTFDRLVVKVPRLKKSVHLSGADGSTTRQRSKRSR